MSGIQSPPVSADVYRSGNDLSVRSLTVLAGAPFNVNAGPGQVWIGAGDQIAPQGTSISGQLLDIRSGTSASPDTSAAPLIRTSRTFSGTAGAPFVGSPVDQVASISASALATATSQIQVFGLSGYGETASTQIAGSNGAADATGVAGVAIASGSSTHIGIGGFFLGSNRSSAAGSQARVSGIQVAAENRVPGNVDATVNATGFSGGGIWLTTGNSFAKVATAIEIGYSGIGGFGAKSGLFDVGIHATVNGGNAAIDTALIQDDASGLYSYLINGTHSTAAIAVKAGSGPILIGETTRSGGAPSSLFEVNTASLLDPMINYLGGSGISFSVRIANGNGSGKWCMVGGAGNFMTGSAAGDTLYQVSSNAYHVGSSTQKVLTVNSSGQLGFFAKTPVGQQSTTGTATGFTANSGTAVNDASTFTGGTGATAYVISDVVLALKNYGLLAA